MHYPGAMAPRDGGPMFGTCTSPSTVIAAKAAIQYAATERFLPLPLVYGIAR
jgi:hypothetical protein